MDPTEFKKSYWQGRSSPIWTFYCPHCRIQRALPLRPQPGSLRHYCQVGLTALIFTLATWPLFTWKGIVSFVPFWTVFETFYRARVRAALSCRHCGFDPYLYKIDIQKARGQIEAHWRKKFAEKGIPYPEKTTPSLTGSAGES